RPTRRGASRRGLRMAPNPRFRRLAAPVPPAKFHTREVLEARDPRAPSSARHGPRRSRGGARRASAGPRDWGGPPAAQDTYATAEVGSTGAKTTLRRTL